jgi:hypothetical protein
MGLFGQYRKDFSSQGCPALTHLRPASIHLDYFDNKRSGAASNTHRKAINSGNGSTRCDIGHVELRGDRVGAVDSGEAAPDDRAAADPGRTGV